MVMEFTSILFFKFFHPVVLFTFGVLVVIRSWIVVRQLPSSHTVDWPHRLAIHDESLPFPVESGPNLHQPREAQYGIEMP